MQGSQNATVKILESPVANERVEVLLEQDNDASRLVLRYSTWTDGLGWCSQKTIQLDSEQLDELHHAITVARHRLNRQRVESGNPIVSGKVIQLPSLS